MGSRRTLVASDSVYAYVRAHESSRALVAFNSSEEDAVLELDLNPEYGPGVEDVVSGTRHTVSAGRVRLGLKPQSSALYTFGIHE